MSESNECLPKWHLAENQLESEVTNLELALWRVFAGFVKWQEDCQKCLEVADLTANDIALLHIIRINNRSKTAYDLARLLNRDDMHNIQYSLRKMLKLKMITKGKDSQKKTITYQISKIGIEHTDAFTQLRKKILMHLVSKEANLNLVEAADVLTKFKGIYDEASKIASTYKSPL